MAFVIEIENLKEIQDLFKAMPKEVDAELKKSVKQAGALILAREKQEAPVGKYKGGNLRRSIGMEYFDIGVRIGPGLSAPYAGYVHFGTGIYGERHDYIRPRKAKVLRFVSGGKVIYTRKVAGQRPNPFVERTQKAMDAPVNAIFDKCLTNILSKL